MGQDASRNVEPKYYRFRIRKRDAHGLAVVLGLWFLWSQAGELQRLFGGLFAAL